MNICFPQVDQTLKTVDSYQNYWKQSAKSALGLVGKAKDAALDAVGAGKQVVTDVQEHGPVEAAKAYYGKYEPWVENKAYGIWKFGLRFPLVPQVRCDLCWVTLMTAFDHTALLLIYSAWADLTAFSKVLGSKSSAQRFLCSRRLTSI
jgi:hypothetical protein